MAFMSITDDNLDLHDLYNQSETLKVKGNVEEGMQKHAIIL